MSRDLQGGTKGKNGTINITCEEKSSRGQDAYIKFNGRVSASNPVFYVVWKLLASGSYKPVYKSEMKKPVKGIYDWSEFKIDTEVLCNQNHDQKIKVEILEASQDGNHKILGSALTDFDSL